MYRRTKREAVQTMQSIFLMTSILAQVFVHIICILPLYLTERQWLCLALPILIHYISILMLKIILAPTLFLDKSIKETVATLHVVGSSIINVNAIPPEGWKRRASKVPLMETDTNNQDVDKEATTNLTEEEVNDTLFEASDHNPSSFSLQTIYFTIKFIENIIFVLLVVYYHWI